MAREFDIYLNRQVAECDLMVLSLTFRDGLTADNRIILDTCIQAYSLYKFAASQMHSKIEAHIDEMLKTCYEMFHEGIELDVDARFQVHYTAYPDNKHVLNLETNDVSALISMFNEVESTMRLGIDRIEASIGKSVGGGSSEIEMDASLESTLKNSLLSVQNQLQAQAEVLSTSKRGYVAADTPIGFGTALERLCYRVTRAASTSVEFSALVLGTEIHYSFGRAFVNVALGSSVRGASAIKCEIAQNTMCVLASLVESVTQYMSPEETNGVAISFAAESVAKHPRRLSELDEKALSEIDEMTLDDLYYIILE